MTICEHLDLGRAHPLGEHRFTLEEIRQFAAKYDPMPMHLDASATLRSNTGTAAASIWLVCGWWMRLNLAFYGKWTAHLAASGGPRLRFGPSPGFRGLRLLRPVHAGDSLAYQTTVTSAEPHAWRENWYQLEMLADALAPSGETLLNFKAGALLEETSGG